MRYVHTNIIANDWRILSDFYQNVFCCMPTGQKRDLRGKWLDELTDIEGVHIEGEHLLLPGYGENGPTLEIFTYSQTMDTDKFINKSGFSHIAFEVEDVDIAVAKLLSAGGAVLGKTVSKDYGGIGIGTFAYAKDPEGNFIELQSWQRK